MASHSHCCQAMANIVIHGNLGIIYVDVFREYMIAGIGPQPRTSLLIAYCPFCGARLSRSCRSRWMAEYDMLASEHCAVHDVTRLPSGLPDVLCKPCDDAG